MTRPWLSKLLMPQYFVPKLHEIVTIEHDGHAACALVISTPIEACIEQFDPTNNDLTYRPMSCDILLGEKIVNVDISQLQEAE